MTSSDAAVPVESGTLYIVATPIGHRDDVSHRALAVLSGVDRLYAEDTRHTRLLLQHHGIATRPVALHEHNETDRLEAIIEHLRGGGSAALVSDAGTPLISDPGYRVVRACRQHGMRVSPIPGASALTAALSVSGLPTDRFEFVGFPPARASARQRWLGALARRPHTLVMYEATHRIVDCLHDIQACLGSTRELTLARELTKRFETILHGTAAEVSQRLQADPLQQKGEFVLVVAGADENAAQSETSGQAFELQQLLEAVLPHVPVKTAARIGAELSGLPKREVYQRALALKGDEPG